MNIRELQAELIKGEYPFLRPDHDPDIERYYELRSIGRAADALVLYNKRLRPRYPDDVFRTKILRAYRLRAPSYVLLQEQAYFRLGAALLERIKRLIKYMAIKADAYDPQDAYSTLKCAEQILAMLPKDHYEAVASMERFLRYAEKLKYHAASMAKAEFLVRSYLNESLTVLEDERRRRTRERSMAAAAERRRLIEQDKADFIRKRSVYMKRYGEAIGTQAPKRLKAKASRQEAVFDLSKLHFSDQDLQRILIPDVLRRLEDKTLAYCFKYWNLVHDAAFDRILFLYSRKYGTRHYEIYTVIRNGRIAGSRDEEILSAVMGRLISGYYYSIRGDMYLQQNWSRLKKRLEGAAPLSVKNEGEKTEKTHTTRKRRKPAAKKKVSKSRETKKSKRVSKAAQPKTKAVSSMIKHETAEPGSLHMLSYPGAFSRAATAQSSKSGYKNISSASVADKLKKLSGRSYDVYQDLFLAKVRPAIRKTLGKGKGLFFSVPEEAENLLYEFMKTHYSDTYMDWESSRERKELEKMGFELSSLDQLIEEAYKAMSA